MMDAVIVMGAVNLGLCMWVVFLQRELRAMRVVLDSTTVVLFDIAEGKAKIERTEAGIQVSKIKEAK